MQNGAKIWLFQLKNHLVSIGIFFLGLNGLTDNLGEAMSTTLVFTIPGAVPRHVSMLIMIGHSLNRRGMEQPAEKALE